MDFEVARAQLIDQLRAEIKDEQVLAVMSRIPREKFIPAENQHLSYEDIPLPIGYNQTISQPFIIALMTASLELKGTEKMLEVGTGSGYQAAILAGLAQRVITVERVPELAESARRTLDSLGYRNVEVHLAGPALGWEQDAPYDAIIVTAAAPKVPRELIEQLVVGGRMVVPVGSRHLQDLKKITRHQKGYSMESLGGCRFVALIGEGAWEE
ncbi:MAG: protein-L-isoaspartate(D-aspartate) O-methyltransferase [Chloroflexota bacterium]